MKQAIVNGVILLPDREVRGMALLFDETILGIVTPEEAHRQAASLLDAEGAFISPGLMDVHIHGYGGVDVSDNHPDDIRFMARRLVENGVTSFLPTTLTVAWETLEDICRNVRGLMRESRQPGFDGAEILGLHMEGPFINPQRKGAQNEAYILPPDPQRILPLADVIRVLTLAPEMPGAMEMIQALRQQTAIALSMGHTSATFQQAMNAIGAGITRATHTFNAMTPLNHREPGVVGAVLNTDVYAELIPDTFHVSAGLFPMMTKVKGNRLVLITDALRSAGMPDGEYENGGQTFILRGVECRLRDGTIAGSVLKLNDGVRNLKTFGQIPMYAAVRAASLAPAESAGLSAHKGSLTPGKDADIVLMTEDCQILRTFVRGKEVYRK